MPNCMGKTVARVVAWYPFTGEQNADGPAPEMQQTDWPPEMDASY